jgi:hypothetical protein
MQMLVDIAFFMFGLAAAGLLGLVVYMWLYGDAERTYTADDLKDYYGAQNEFPAQEYYTPAPVEKVVEARRSKRIRSRKTGTRKPVSKKSKKARRSK